VGQGAQLVIDHRQQLVEAAAITASAASKTRWMSAEFMGWRRHRDFGVG
jgi:hypothetical protein